MEIDLRQLAFWRNPAAAVEAPGRRTITVRWWTAVVALAVLLAAGGLVLAGGDVEPARDGAVAQAATETATPTATPTAQVKGAKGKATKTETPTTTATTTPTETPTPKPTQKPKPKPKATQAPRTLREKWAGWILFLSSEELNFWEEPQLFAMKPDGSRRQRFPDDPGFYQRLKEAYTWSPDKNYRAYVAQDLQVHIYFNQDDTHWPFSQILGGIAYDPQWSPAGGWIAFVTNLDGNDEVYIKRHDGGEQRRITFNEWEWDKHPTWSPDGQRLAFWSNRSGRNQIWVANADGSQPHNISNSPFDDVDPLWVRGE